MKNFEIKNQNGRSMIEMLGVLAIIGVLSVGGIAGYSKAMMKYRTNKTIEQITLISNNIRSFFATQKTYGSIGSHLDKEIIRKAKLVPDEMITLGTDGKISDINTDFSGVSLWTMPKNSTSTTADSFIMGIHNIPQEACIDLATQDWRANSGNSIVHISINGSESESMETFLDTCTTSEKVFCANDIPVSIDKAIIACDKASTNTIYMKFY